MYRNYNYNYYDDRFVPFLAPFLLGGLGGAAIVGLSRPRPVYVNPAPYPYYPPYYGPRPPFYY
jgi:hypothetical protein